MKMVPDRKLNIYPYTKKNVKAILRYFFDIPLGDIKWIFELTNLEINQLEWIAMKVSGNIEFLNDNFSSDSSGRNVSNYMKYGIDGMVIGLDQFEKENERKRITTELLELISN